VASAPSGARSCRAGKCPNWMVVALTELLLR
jgi:hypothetical protein